MNGGTASTPSSIVGIWPLCRTQVCDERDEEEFVCELEVYELGTSANNTLPDILRQVQAL